MIVAFISAVKVHALHIVRTFRFLLGCEFVLPFSLCVCSFTPITAMSSLYEGHLRERLNSAENYWCMHSLSSHIVCVCMSVEWELLSGFFFILRFTAIINNSLKILSPPPFPAEAYHHQNLNRVSKAYLSFTLSHTHTHTHTLKTDKTQLTMYQAFLCAFDNKLQRKGNNWQGVCAKREREGKGSSTNSL